MDPVQQRRAPESALDPCWGGPCAAGGSVNKTPPAEDTHESTNPATWLRPGVQGLEPGLREGLPGTRKEGIGENE